MGVAGLGQEEMAPISRPVSADPEKLRELEELRADIYQGFESWRRPNTGLRTNIGFGPWNGATPSKLPAWMERAAGKGESAGVSDAGPTSKPNVAGPASALAVELPGTAAVETAARGGEAGEPRPEGGAAPTQVARPWMPQRDLPPFHVQEEAGGAESWHGPGGPLGGRPPQRRTREDVQGGADKVGTVPMSW